MDKRTATILDQLAAGRIPRDINGDVEYSEELICLAGYQELNENFTLAISNGDLTKSLTGVRGPVAGSLKSLQASLRHLTWQATQIADGYFSQRVDFMGDFSTAFNSMVEHLSEARTMLEAM